MKQYELLYIVPSQYTDAEAEGVAGGVAELLKKHGGTVSTQKTLGKIRLAYPIKKVRHGTYVLAFFDAETDTIAKIDHALRLHDAVLRHMVSEARPGARDREVRIDSYLAPLSDEARPEKRERGERPPAARKPVSAAAPAPAPSASAPPAKPEKNLSMDDLDKKLDALIDEEVKIA